MAVELEQLGLRVQSLDLKKMEMSRKVKFIYLY